MITVYTQVSKKTSFIVIDKKINNNPSKNHRSKLTFFWHKKPFIHNRQKNIAFGGITKIVFCIDKNLISYTLKSIVLVRNNSNPMTTQISYLFLTFFYQKRFLQLSLIINAMYQPFFILTKKSHTYKFIEDRKKQPLISNFKHL